LLFAILSNADSSKQAGTQNNDLQGPAEDMQSAYAFLAIHQTHACLKDWGVRANLKSDEMIDLLLETQCVVGVGSNLLAT
jgi:hypothetical protein